MGVNVDLKNKSARIPRSKEGNPAFKNMVEVGTVFTDEEQTALVNRALYQMEYQRDSHKKYRAQREEVERPIKDAFKRLFPGTSWMQATDKQIQAAADAVAKERQQNGQ